MPQTLSIWRTTNFLSTARNYKLLFYPGGGGALFHKPMLFRVAWGRPFKRTVLIFIHSTEVMATAFFTAIRSEVAWIIFQQDGELVNIAPLLVIWRLCKTCWCCTRKRSHVSSSIGFVLLWSVLRETQLQTLSKTNWTITLLFATYGSQWCGQSRGLS